MNTGTPVETLPAFLPTEPLRYGRLSVAQVEYTFAPEGDPQGLDRLTVEVRVTHLAMVNLALLMETEPGALRLTMDPVGDVVQPPTDALLDSGLLGPLLDKIANLHIIMTKLEPLVFHFTNITPYEIPMTLTVGAALVTEPLAEELRQKRGPR